MVFLLTQLVPGEPELAYLSQRSLSDEEVVAAFRARWGLDQTLYVEYLTYIKNLAQGDLGTSFRTNRPVLVDLKQYLPATSELALVAIIIAAVFGMAEIGGTFLNTLINYQWRIGDIGLLSVGLFRGDFHTKNPRYHMTCCPYYSPIITYSFCF